MYKVEHVFKSYYENKDDKSNVSKIYALKDINLILPDKGLVYLVGPSGSGKSTLMNILGGMDRNYSGTVKFNSTRINQLSEDELTKFRFSYVGFSFQSNSISKYDRVYQDLYKVLAITSISEYEKNILIDKALEKVNLLDKKNSYTNLLSGGEKKRIGLAKAILKQSDVIFIDEPTGSLDENTSLLVINLIKQISKSSLVIVVTHDLNYIDEESDSIIYLKDGKIDKLVNLENIDKKESVSLLSNKNESSLLPIYKKQKLSFACAFKMFLHSCKNYIKMINFSIVSMVISLVIFSCVFILTTGVKQGLVSTLEGFIKDNGVVMTNKEVKYLSKERVPLSFDELSLVNSELEKNQLNTNKVRFYTGFDVDSLFDKVEFYLENKGYKLTMDQIRLNTYRDFIYLDEVDKNSIYPEDFNAEKLSDQEIGLVLTQYQINSLISFYKLKNITELSNYFKENNVYLNMKVVNDSWDYTFVDYAPRIRFFSVGKSCKIVHTDSLLSKKLFFDFMQLDLIETLSENYQNIENKNPWTIYGRYLISLSSEEIMKLYSVFIKEKYFSEYDCILVNNSSSLSEKTKFVDVVNKTYQTISYQDIDRILNENKDVLSSFDISNSVYTFSEGISFAGFIKNVYVSSQKNYLNEIIDNYSKTDFNMSLPNSINLDLENQFILNGTLSSNSSFSVGKDRNNNFLFSSSIDKEKIIYGRKYKAESEIVISDSAYKTLFGKDSTFSEQNLSFLILTESKMDETDSSKYINKFNTFNLKVVGVVDNDNYFIYQDNLFPSMIGFSYGNSSVEELLFSNVVFYSKDDKSIDQSFVNLLNSKYSKEFSFSQPSKQMREIIDTSLKKITLLLLIFSLISSLISLCLLYLTVYLILKKDEIKIKEFTILGYTKKDILMYYFVYIVSISLVSLVISYISTYICNLMINHELINMFSGTYSITFIPYLMILLLLGIIILIVFILLLIKIKRLKLKNIMNIK